MKWVSRSIKEKGTKTSYLNRNSEQGIKLPIDETCFPIQVHAISSGKGNKEVSSPTEVSFVNDSTDDKIGFDYGIRRDIMENSRNI
jgi:hypothetical protein